MKNRNLIFFSMLIITVIICMTIYFTVYFAKINNIKMIENEIPFKITDISISEDLNIDAQNIDANNIYISGDIISTLNIKISPREPSKEIKIKSIYIDEIEISPMKSSKNTICQYLTNGETNYSNANENENYIFESSQSENWDYLYNISLRVVNESVIDKFALQKNKNGNDINNNILKTANIARQDVEGIIKFDLVIVDEFDNEYIAKIISNIGSDKLYESDYSASVPDASKIPIGKMIIKNK